MRTPDPLALVVERDPAFLAAVDLHVGGVQVDRHRLAQRRRPSRPHHGQRSQRRGGHIGEPGLHRMPLRVGEPARQPGRRGRGQPGHHGQHLPGLVGTLAVQPDEEVLPGQLRRGDPDQQLPAAQPPIPGLDRADDRVQQLIIASRSTSSVTAIAPENRVSDASGAPIRTRRRTRRISRTLPTR